ncbi:MAG: hypothetical protein M1829_004237 [Trizodia sp. TS-e1964]|nr:MAG: hypothetical protein M1829_004237 [Trizodia sp. TS-e1964]
MSKVAQNPAAATLTNPTAQTVAALLPKLQDADSDFRFMALNDLFTALTHGTPSFLLQDYNVSARAVDGVLKTLDDQNGEVQNLSIKCLAPLSTRVPAGILPPMLEKISNLSTPNSVDNSIPSTALRTVVTSFPRPVRGTIYDKATDDAYAAISKVLIPRLVGYLPIPSNVQNLPIPPKGMLEANRSKGVDPDSIEVLIEVIRCFGIMLQNKEISALQKAIMAILDEDRSSMVVKKRTIVALSLLAHYFTDEVLSTFISHLIESFRNPHLTLPHRRLLLNIIGSLARSIPRKFGPHLKTLAPFVLGALSELELDEQMDEIYEGSEPNSQTDEVREAALVALEGLLASCSNEMRGYTEISIAAAVRFLTYDPMLSNGESDGQDMDTDEDGADANGFAGEEDFEEEAGFSDDDDLSWKVRRCAAKVLYTIISTRASGDLLENGILYERVAPVLVNSFKEREENVRLEILSTLGSLIRKTGEGAAVLNSISMNDSHSVLISLPHGRKRRRGSSDAHGADTQAPRVLISPVAPPPPATGPRASLAQLTPSIVKGTAKLLEGHSTPTKQAAITLLRDIVAVQHGGLSEYMNQIINPLIDAVKSVGSHQGGNMAPLSSGGGAAAATGSSLKIEALMLIGAIAETHPSSVLLPYLQYIVPGVSLAVKDKFFKTSGEAVATVEQLIKVMTPPRCAAPNQAEEAHLNTLYEVLANRVAANDADLEVRRLAIRALGVLLARTSGAESIRLLSKTKRYAALDILYERLKNETTRISAILAVDAVAVLTLSKDAFPPNWVKKVTLELGSQLRKTDRVLRGASLSALKNIIVNPAGIQSLDTATMQELSGYLYPLLSANDIQLLGPALIVLANLVQSNAAKIAGKDMKNALCNLALAPLRGAALDALLLLVKNIGEAGVGKSLMKGLLGDVGVHGDPATVGRAIGTLLVYGNDTIGYSVNDFVNELENAGDDQRRCLALAVLGEACFRLGPGSPIEPETFIKHFNSNSDKMPLPAAIALGRAGAGNAQKFLPIILDTMDKAGNSQYLLLHSIKEILQHANDSDTNIKPYSKQMWEKLLPTSQAEDNKAVGAECIGRLVVVDPKTYLPLLQARLKDKKAGVRGMAIQAIRYTLADTDESYDEMLRPALIDMIIIMLGDSELDNRRLALTTLNSATHNKPQLILPHLGRLVPLVMKESFINPELIREVQMGPFKHKVDDGLEVRKSAYETLYALLETSFSRINVGELYDRVIVGLDDEHDIRVLCNLMLLKLIALDPEETLRRLDMISERFRLILTTKIKENAVKQEIEKLEATIKGVLKVSYHLNSSFPTAAATVLGGQHQLWKTYWEAVKKDYATQLKIIEEDSRDKGGWGGIKIERDTEA